MVVLWLMMQPQQRQCWYRQYHLLLAIWWKCIIDSCCYFSRISFAITIAIATTTTTNSSHHQQQPPPTAATPITTNTPTTTNKTVNNNSIQLAWLVPWWNNLHPSILGTILPPWLYFKLNQGSYFATPKNGQKWYHPIDKPIFFKDVPQVKWHIVLLVVVMSIILHVVYHLCPS